MPYTPELIDEINTLLRFDPPSSRNGIKIHSVADSEIIAATERLYAKGLVTQIDGGYLTPLGRDTAERADVLLSILVTPPALAKPLL